MKKLSIIMPSLNVAEYFDECIMSAISQTIQDIEIICVDAGSTDGTLEKIHGYVERTYPGITIKCLESEKRSYGYQVNLGLAAAVGKYVAILETDDYVEPDMYEELYLLAESHELDYVTADFDRVVTLSDGYVKRKTVSIFEEESPLYNSVHNFSENAYLYANDYNIWKGIYRRSFLEEQDIRFNESPGAAFQDIGFSEQVHACAKKGYYTNKSFYRYRCDRDGASVKSNKGLMYAYNEFYRLMNTETLWKKIKYKPGFYYHMGQSFYGELCKVLEMENYNLESEYIKPYVAWFAEQLNLAIEQRLFTEQLVNPDLFHMVKDIIGDTGSFADNLRKALIEKETHEDYICNQAKGKQVIIFGAGIRGDNCIDLLQAKDVSIAAISDNKVTLWGTKKYDIPILSPEEATELYKEMDEICFVVASKFYTEEIKEQLLKNGVAEQDIIF